MKELLFLVFLTFPFISIAQKIQHKIFMPTKDANIFYLEDKTAYEIKPNYGKSKALEVANWTWNGSYGKRASLIDFDLKSIPKNAIITKATLIFHKLDIFNDGKYPQLKISVITNNWDEYTVNWDNKPAISPTKSLVVTDTKSIFNIDVTELIQDKLHNPYKNKGLYIEVNGDEVYHGVAFASRECKDTSLRPKLTVEYFVLDKKNKFEIYTMLIYNSDWQLVKNKKIYSMKMFFDAINNLKGDKFLCITIQNDTVVASTIIDKTNTK